MFLSKRFFILLWAASSVAAFSQPSTFRLFSANAKLVSPAMASTKTVVREGESLANENERNQDRLLSAMEPKSSEEESNSIERFDKNGFLSAAEQRWHAFLAAGGGDDPVGTRGEAYFFAQAILIVFLVLGGIPLVSDYLQLLAGPGLMLAGTVVLALTGLDMSDSLSPWSKPNGGGLVRTGLYGQVRHPMYTGLLATMAGFSVWTGSLNRILLTVLLYLAIEVKSEYEEGELVKAYPDYEEYRKEVTGKFVPMALSPWKKTKE